MGHLQKPGWAFHSSSSHLQLSQISQFLFIPAAPPRCRKHVRSSFLIFLRSQVLLVGNECVFCVSLQHAVIIYSIPQISCFSSVCVESTDSTTQVLQSYQHVLQQTERRSLNIGTVGFTVYGSLRGVVWVSIKGNIKHPAFESARVALFCQCQDLFFLFVLVLFVALKMHICLFFSFCFSSSEDQIEACHQPCNVQGRW